MSLNEKKVEHGNILRLWATERGKDEGSVVKVKFQEISDIFLWLLHVIEIT